MGKSVLIVGSGGREHALAWKISQSPKVNKIFVAPGNGGTDAIAENVAISFTDVPALLDFAKKNKIDLTVIGQEASSEAGLVDAFKKAGLLIFGPTKAATKIESSKVFSKDLMAQENIPTAEYMSFSDPKKALSYIRTRRFPVVIKADGLATGKGVIICQNKGEALDAVNSIMVKKIFGDAGSNVVVEDFLSGQEVSVHALCDGKSTVIFPASQDHKQIFDGDKGPNTGGMGVIAPVDWVTPKHLENVKKKIVLPALAGLRKNNAEFSGCLYPGLMIDNNKIKLLEFNARFGDPEAEVYMRLLEGDLFDIFSSCAKGKLDPKSVSWKPGYAVSVVLASGGYPGDYAKNLPISGIDEAEKNEDIVVFHAGTTRQKSEYLTSGGRVLNVTATGKTLDSALVKAYQAIKLIHFDGMHYRTDIGKRPNGG